LDEHQRQAEQTNSGGIVRRGLLVCAVLLVIITASCMQYDGALTVVDPDLGITVQNSDQWNVRPLIMTRTDDPDGVYIFAPDVSEANPVPAVRVSSTTGRQTSTLLRLGPASGTRDPLPTRDVRALVYGLHFTRPAYNPLMFVSSNPGFYKEDSATGRIDIVFERDGRRRRLLTERAFNSNRIEELRDAVKVDPGGRWIAMPRRGDDLAWRLSVWRIHGPS
jgi:hypothetical protein